MVHPLLQAKRLLAKKKAAQQKQKVSAAAAAAAREAKERAKKAKTKKDTSKFNQVGRRSSPLFSLLPQMRTSCQPADCTT